MNNSEKLKNLLNQEIIPDVEAAIDELFSQIDKNKNAGDAQREELDELRDMRTECYAILEDIERGGIDEDEIEELLKELIDLKTE